MATVTPISLSSSDPLERQGLPRDYAALTTDGQRLARVNAVRQHLVPGPLPERADRFVRALHFFDAYYLQPEVIDGDKVWDSYFYDLPLPSPPLHDLMSRSLIMYRTSLEVGPRGFAKTKLTAKECLVQMLAEPTFQITYGTSTNDLTELFGDSVKFQVESNERINDDFGPEYGGYLKPHKGQGAWGMTNFKLTNRSGLFCTSAESRQRGLRPRVYYLDDPEWDPKQSTSMEVLRLGCENLIFRQALPMVMRAGARLAWRGTFVSKQHYLWQAAQVNGEGKPLDDRFGVWFRLIIPLVLVSPDGTQRSAWPHMWPIDDAERARLCGEAA